MANNQVRQKINLLDLVPVRTIKWENQDEGLISLLKPKFRNPILARYLLPRLKNPYFRIKLDEVGSHVWKLCNGTRTVREVADELKDKFGEKVEPTYDRLALFLHSLEKNRFIELKNKPPENSL